MPQPKAIIVSFEQKSYTFDGQRWYGTEDYVAPPNSMVYKLNALIPVKPIKVKASVAAPK